MDNKQFHKMAESLATDTWPKYFRTALYLLRFDSLSGTSTKFAIAGKASDSRPLLDYLRSDLTGLTAVSAAEAEASIKELGVWPKYFWIGKIHTLENLRRFDSADTPGVAYLRNGKPWPEPVCKLEEYAPGRLTFVPKYEAEALIKAITHRPSTLDLIKKHKINIHFGDTSPVVCLQTRAFAITTMSIEDGVERIRREIEG